MGLDGRLRRRAGRETAVLASVAILGVGTASLIDGAVELDIADQPSASVTAHADGQEGSSPPTHEPAITQPPALTVSSREPFAWVVAMSASDDGRWCMTSARGTTELTDHVGQPCDQYLRIEQGVSWNEATNDAAEGQQLAWGVAPTGTDHVVVEFTDGTRREARLAAGTDVDATLWALGYEDGEVRLVEAQGEGVAAGAVALDGFDVVDLLQVLGGVAGVMALLAATRWLVLRRND